MAIKKCPKCGRAQEATVLSCDCGADLPASTLVRDRDDMGVVRSRDYKEGSFRGFCLTLGAVLSIVGMLAAFAIAVRLIAAQEWLYGLVVAPLSGFYSLAMYFVFRHAAED